MIEADLESDHIPLKFTRVASSAVPFRVSRAEIDNDMCAQLDAKTRRARVTSSVVILAAISAGILEVTGQQPAVAQVVHDLRRGCFFDTAGQFADYVFVRLPHDVTPFQGAYLQALFQSLELAIDYALPSEYFTSKTRLPWCHERRARGFQCCDIILNYFSANKSPTRVAKLRRDGGAGDRPHTPRHVRFRPYELNFRNEFKENFTGVILETIAIRHGGLDIRLKWACDFVPESKQRAMEDAIIGSMLRYIGTSGPDT